MFFYVVFKLQAITAFKMGDEINLKLPFLLDIFTNAVGYLPEIIVYNLRNFYFKVFKKTSNRISELQSGIASIPMYAKYYFEALIIIIVVALIYFGNFS